MRLIDAGAVARAIALLPRREQFASYTPEQVVKLALKLVDHSPTIIHREVYDTSGGCAHVWYEGEPDPYHATCAYCGKVVSTEMGQ